MDNNEKLNRLGIAVPDLVLAFGLNSRRGDLAAMFSYDEATERLEAKILDMDGTDLDYRSLSSFDGLDLPSRVFTNSETKILLTRAADSTEYQATFLDASGFPASMATPVEVTVSEHSVIVRAKTTPATVDRTQRGGWLIHGWF